MKNRFLSDWIILFIMVTILMYFISPATFLTVGSVIFRLILTGAITYFSTKSRN